MESWGRWIVSHPHGAEVGRLRTKGKFLFWEFSFDDTDRLQSWTTC